MRTLWRSRGGLSAFSPFTRPRSTTWSMPLGYGAGVTGVATRKRARCAVLFRTLHEHSRQHAMHDSGRGSKVPPCLHRNTKFYSDVSDFINVIPASLRIIRKCASGEGSHSGSDCSLQVLTSAKSSTMLCCMGLAPCEDCTVMQEYRKRLAIFEVFAKGVRDYYARIGDDPNAV